MDSLLFRKNEPEPSERSGMCGRSSDQETRRGFRLYPLLRHTALGKRAGQASQDRRAPTRKRPGRAGKKTGGIVRIGRAHAPARIGRRRLERRPRHLSETRTRPARRHACIQTRHLLHWMADWQSGNQSSRGAQPCGSCVRYSSVGTNQLPRIRLSLLHHSAAHSPVRSPQLAADISSPVTHVTLGILQATIARHPTPVPQSKPEPLSRFWFCAIAWSAVTLAGVSANVPGG